MKVKALYHFLDKKACRNRTKGDVFDAPEPIAEKLAKAGLVEILELKPKKETPVVEKQPEKPTFAEEKNPPEPPPTRIIKEGKKPEKKKKK